MDPQQVCRRAIAAHLPADGTAPPHGCALIACSGGADSLALVRAAAAAAGRWRVEAVVIDHGLQVDSAVIAESARAACIALGVPAHVVRVDVAEGSGGLESAARDARYTALRARARAIGADRILLGHTRDDQAETVLMRLARGSGARSLAGMAAVSGDLHRPFLALPRSVVRASVTDLDAWEDPHNTDPRFLRPRVRAHLLPAVIEVLGSAAIDGLARTAALLRDDADALDEWAAAELRRIQRPCAEAGTCSAAGVCLDVADLAGCPRAIRTRVLRRAAIEAGAAAGALTRAHVDAVEVLISGWHGQGGVALPGPVTAERRYGRLCLTAGSMMEGGTHAS